MKSMMPLDMRRVFPLFLLLVLFLFFTTRIFAQTTSPSATMEQPTQLDDSVSTDPAMLDDETTQDQSEYVLPYPGMLPTNPLFFLKNLRDTFIGFIISDPLKKAEFELLQADKKLSTAQFLLKEDSHNIDLALSSVEESTSHLQTAFTKLSETKVKSTDSQAVFQKMAASLAKHEEIATQLSETTKNSAFLKHADQASALEEKVESYL